MENHLLLTGYCHWHWRDIQIGRHTYLEKPMMLYQIADTKLHRAFEKWIVCGTN